MLGLPSKAEVSKMLPKKAIYGKFNMTTAQKAKFDADISRISIVGEITPVTTQIAAGKTVQGFYILQIVLKNKKYDEKAIASLQKLIAQRMIFLLQYESQYCLAYYHNRLYHTEWVELNRLLVPLSGLDLDIVWENTIKQIVCGENDAAWDVNATIEENITAETHRRKLITDIASLEKKVRSEKQLNRQIQLNEELKRMRKELEQKYGMA